MSLRRMTAALVPLALVAAACTDDDDNADTEAAETTAPSDEGEETREETTTTAAETPSEATSPDGLVVHITTPEEGQQVNMAFEIKFETTAQLGDADSGGYHMHLYYDGNTNRGEFDMVFGNTFTIDRELSEGPHVLRVELVKADHTATGAFHQRSVMVGGAADGGDG